MRTVYVMEQGAILRRDGPVLQVWTGKKRKAELLVHDLDQLVLMGNIMVTPAVLDFLISERVDTVFMSLHGRFRGRLMHDHSKNVFLRLAQYRALQDPDTALRVARWIVVGKIQNSRTFFMKSARRRGNVPSLTVAAEELAAVAASAAAADSLDRLRGFEGRASAVYFEAFGDLLRNPDFSFSGRNRRPPLDPVNVLLSLGYTLLANAVETAVQVTGMDPFLGALHEPAYGRPSLVCDLMEEYRSIVVDPMVVAAINQRSFQRDDFEEDQEGGPIRITRSAMRWFVELFERRLRSRIYYPPRRARLTYRQVIEEQVRMFARWVMGTEECYAPFLVR